MKSWLFEKVRLVGFYVCTSLKEHKTGNDEQVQSYFDIPSSSRGQSNL